MKFSRSFKKGLMSTTDANVGWGMMIGGLALVVIVAGVLVYKIATASDMTTYATILTETKNFRPSNGYGTSDYVPTLINANVLPKSVSIQSNKIYNKAGGEITVVGAGVGFTMTSTKVSRGDCISTAQRYSILDMSSTKINGTSFTGEVTAPDANAACTSGNNNTIAFTTNS
ncbi:type 4 pilus major pilin [Acinetobacter variabilis]|uniref:type 4 pilus major pilin n=1 Tax=Acinetobacter variabilis TaxID=70346 RepID=UPI0028A86BAA|nr:type 4 pilus major pilin [Acinetobacter variabilis]